MAFGMFSAAVSPIAIDFGSSSVKLLQLGTGERPQLLAAAELPISEALRTDQDGLMLFYSQELPKLLKEGRFKGRRVVTAVPSGQTLIQHMQVASQDGVSRDDLLKGQIESQMSCAPNSTVVRSYEVKEVNRGGQARTEMICFAVARQNVMRYIALLKKMRLEVVGMHTETVSMIRAFDHLCRREADSKVTTLFVDMGWSGARVALTHGKMPVFARYIQVGGRHFDHLIAKSLHCDVQTARKHRLSLQPEESMHTTVQPQPIAGDGRGNAILDSALSKRTEAGTAVAINRRTGETPPELAQQVAPALDECPVDMTELLDTMTDELSMCLRYHHGLFPERKVNRVIFLGGESRQVWLCQHIVRRLGLPAQLGDPLARLEKPGNMKTPNLDLSKPQPGWAVAYGLCSSPTDI